MGEGPEARGMDGRVGDLERWQGVVDYRLEAGEKRFSALSDGLHRLDQRQDELEKHVIEGNRNTAALKQSWETWLADWKEARRTSQMLRPKWWQVAIGITGVLVTCGSLAVTLVVLAHGGIKP